MPDEQDPIEESEGMKALRAKAERGSQAEADNATLKREMAFMKAGVSTESKPAQALLASYEGELTTEAITAEAGEWGLVEASGTPEGDPPQEQDPSEGQPTYDPNTPQAQHQAVRENLEGQPAPVNPPPTLSAGDLATAKYVDNREAGMPTRDAEVQAFSDFIYAGGSGDKSAVYDPAAFAAKADAQGHGSKRGR